jgi:hypothetical protein
MTAAEKLALGQRIAKHKAPGVHLTTEQLMEAAIQTVKQMSPEEKATLCRKINYAVLTKAEKRRVN